jgi:hypothetical protein
MTPPQTLDGATVLHWVWSDEPLGALTHSDGTFAGAVHGQAICQYAGDRGYYRFSCDRDWAVVQDSTHETIDDAKAAAAQLYNVTPGAWRSGTSG